MTRRSGRKRAFMHRPHVLAMVAIIVFCILALLRQVAEREMGSNGPQRGQDEIPENAAVAGEEPAIPLTFGRGTLPCLIEGTVRGVSGPVEALVRLHSQKASEDVAEMVMPATESCHRACATGPGGLFHFDGLEPGTYHVVAETSWGTRFRATARLDPHDVSTRCDIFVERGDMNFSGVAVWKTGEPFRGQVSAWVGRRWLKGVEIPPVPADDVGRFSFAALPEGRVQVCFTANGFKYRHEVEIPSPREVFVVDEGVERAVLRVVEEATGQPIANARVMGATESESVVSTSFRGRMDGRRPYVFPACGKTVALQIVADGFCTFQEVVPLQDSITVHLLRKTVASGRVFDGRSGEPLPGVPVMFRSSAAVPEGMQTARTVTTADGHFSLAVGSSGVIVVAGQGWVSRELVGLESRLPPGPVFPCPPGGGIEVQVIPAARATVQVVDATGRPTSDCRVFIENPPEWTGFQLADENPETTATSAGDGRFEFITVVPRIPYVIVVRDTAGQEARSEAFRLEAGELREFQLTFHRSRNVEIRVTDNETGRPLVGASVSLRSSIWRRKGRTGPDGAVAFPDAPREAISVQAAHDGYGPSPVGLVLGNDENMAHIQLPVAEPLRGRVLLAEGMSPEKVLLGLRARNSDGQSGWLYHGYALRSDGSFRLAAPPGMWELVLFSNDMVGRAMAKWDVRAGQQELVLDSEAGAVDAGPELTIRVSDANGADVSGMCSLYGATDRIREPRPFTNGVTVCGLPAEDFWVLISRTRAAGGAELPTALRGPFPAGTRTAEVTIGSPAPVRGRILGPSGSPLSGVEVHAFPHDAELGVVGAFFHPRTSTDEEGRFALDTTADGDWELYICPSLAIAPPRSIVVKAGSTVPDMQLDRGADLTLWITDEAGEPVPAASAVIELEGPSGPLFTRRARTDDTGHLVISGIGVAPWSLKVIPPADRPALVPVNMHTTGGIVPVALRDGIWVFGKVVGGSTIYPGALVWWRTVGEWQRTAADGWGRFRILVPSRAERLTLRASRPTEGLQGAGSQVDVVPCGASPIVLRLR